MRKFDQQIKDLTISGILLDRLKKEFDELVLEFKKELIRGKLEDIGRNIQKFEQGKGADEGELEKYTKEFDKLSKELNELSN